jgi:hypothetical protein
VPRIVLNRMSSVAQSDCCKLCKREFWNTPNPFSKDPGPGDLLQRRRPRGLECSPCDAFVPTHDKYSKMQKANVKKLLESDDGEQRQYNLELEKFEEVRRNGGKVGRLCRGKASINVYKKSEFQTKMIMGYFWTVALYMEHHDGKKPDAKKMTTIEHNGRKLRGIILDDTHGKPIGVIECNQSSLTGTRNEGEVLSTDNAVDDENYENTWRGLQDKFKGAAAADKNGEVSLKVATTTTKDKDNE